MVLIPTYEIYIVIVEKCKSTDHTLRCIHQIIVIYQSSELTNKMTNSPTNLTENADPNIAPVTVSQTHQF